MRGQVADDQPRGAGAEAVAAHGALGGVDQQRMVSEPEVVVGREVDGAPAVDDHLGGLAAVNWAHPT